MELLRVENLSKSYGKGEAKVDALKNINLSIKKGEFIAIVGPSGSGKSTLLHLLGGVDKPTSGNVFINDINIYDLKEKDLAIFRRRNVGLIYQFYNLIPVLTVKENILLPAELDNRKIDKEYLEDLLKKIYDDKAKIETEKAQTVKALEEAQKLRDSLRNQHSNVSEREKELISNAKQEAKQILLDAKETANSLIRDISSTNSASQANKLRNKLNDKIASVSATSENAVIDSISPAILRENIKPGLNVYVSNLKTNGTVVSNISKDDTVQVQIGMMKMKVDIKNLHETSSASTSGKNKSGKNSGAQISNGSNYSQKSSFKAQSVSPEINLLGMTVDEAIPIVDKYLDDCYIAKLSPVRIVHGKGTGALRNGIQKYLKTNKIVDNFRPGTFR